MQRSFPAHGGDEPTSEAADATGSNCARPRVFYVSYDGVGEPLGRSQVLNYLTRLARDYEVTLVSFEKADADRGALARELAAASIRWIPLSYHQRPPVISTVGDVVAGVRALRHASRVEEAAIVHVRSYVPALIALLARRWTHGRLIFDIRGFWADERVEGGLWPEGGWLYKLAKRCERWFFAEADAVVTLTHASVAKVREWLGEREVPVVVIPTCADIQLFSRLDSRPDGPQATWVGSIGTWYRFDLAAPLAEALEMPLNVVTRQADLAREILRSPGVSVKTLPLQEVPGELFSGDVGLCLYVSSFSRVATAPTRLGEYLAAGMPVIVTPGVGDLEQIVQEHRVGAVLRGDSPEELARVASEVRQLAADPAARERCRNTARLLFDVDTGAARYGELYRELLRVSSSG